MNISASRFLPIILIMLIAPLGYWLGEELSVWGARIHPVEGWRHWHISQGTKCVVRKEMCSDTIGAIHLAGVCPSNDLWNGSISRSLHEVKSKGFYECHCRLRGNGESPVCLLVIDHRDRRNLVEQFFTPPKAWQDFRFEFSVEDAKNLGISFYFGDRSIDVDLETIAITPIDQTKSAASKECEERTISRGSWSMRPVAKDGSTLLLDQEGDRSGDLLFRMSERGRQTTSLATQIVGVSSGTRKVGFQFEASAQPAAEVEYWLADANGNESERQIVELSENIEKRTIATVFTSQSPELRIHLRPITRCNLRVRSATLTVCPDDPFPKDLLDARLIRLVQDQGVVASVKKSSNPEGPVSLISDGNSAQVTRFDLPLAVEGERSSRIVLKARADHDLTLRLVVAENHDPWNAIGDSKDFLINSEWKEIELPFRSKVSDAKARLVLSLNDSKATVEVSDIRLISEDDGAAVQESNR